MTALIIIALGPILAWLASRASRLRYSGQTSIPAPVVVARERPKPRVHRATAEAKILELLDRGRRRGLDGADLDAWVQRGIDLLGWDKRLLP